VKQARNTKIEKKKPHKRECSRQDGNAGTPKGRQCEREGGGGGNVATKRTAEKNKRREQQQKGVGLSLQLFLFFCCSFYFAFGVQRGQNTQIKQTAASPV
jgi:hypothetical protein